jgi:superfamily II DNA or RNA helicase
MSSISFHGYGLPKSHFKTPEELERLKQSLTVEPYIAGAPTGANNKPKISLYLESSKKIYIPKCYGLEHYGTPSCVKLPAMHTLPNLTFTGSLRPQQESVVQAYLSHVKENETNSGGILNLECGFGKTVVGLYLVSQLGVKTMIIAHKDFLIEQWKQRIQEFLPEARIGIIKAKALDVADKDIVLASLQSLSMKTYDDGVFDGIGLLIIDEVHRTATEVFSQALMRYTFRYTLGLSATIARKDGMQKVFQWYLGKVLYKSKRQKENVIVDNVNYFEFDLKYYKEEYLYNGKLNGAKMINNIAEYEPRTRKIADILTEYIRREDNDAGKRRKILVLSDRKAHLRFIQSLLPSDITSGFYIGGMKPAELAQSETKDVILATYSFASEGFDAKDLDTLLLATPKTDIEQSVGRILRTKEEDRVNVPVIIDIVDQIPFFERQFQKRHVFYKKLGYVIKYPLQEKSKVDDQMRQGICLIRNDLE